MHLSIEKQGCTNGNDKHEYLKAVYELLNEKLGSPGWEEWWPADSCFERIVGAILIQQTRWENVDKVLAVFKAKGLMTPRALASVSTDELEMLVRPVGFYRQKARYLKSVAEYFSRYPIERMRSLPLPQLRKELLALHGVGNETADVIILYTADRPRFIVDAYARRLFGCLGFEGQLRADYSKCLKKPSAETLKLHKRYHGLIVEHGKRYCNKKKCDTCVANDAQKYLA